MTCSLSRRLPPLSFFDSWFVFCFLMSTFLFFVPGTCLSCTLLACFLCVSFPPWQRSVSEHEPKSKRCRDPQLQLLERRSDKNDNIKSRSCTSIPLTPKSTSVAAARRKEKRTITCYNRHCMTMNQRRYPCRKRHVRHPRAHSTLDNDTFCRWPWTSQTTNPAAESRTGPGTASCPVCVRTGNTDREATAHIASS